MTSRSHPIILEAQFSYGFTDLGSAPPSTWPEIAFAGRSNVGKSSLLNALLQRKNLVRTSSTPGCTRQINAFLVRLEHLGPLHLIDLPGFGFAKRSKTERKQWGSMIDQYLRDRAALAGVVVLVDVRRGPESLEASLIQYLQEIREPAIPYLLVATKVDKLPAAQLKPRLDALRKTTPGRIIGFSAKTGLGREELWKQLLEAIPASNRQKACL